MNESTKIRNEKGKVYKCPAYTRPVKLFIHDGHDSKVNERCYEVEKEY